MSTATLTDHLATAKGLLEWNDALPNIRTADVTPEGHATPLYAVIADYGWAERIVASGLYSQDALMLEAALNAVVTS